MGQVSEFARQVPFREAENPVKRTFSEAMERTITVPRKRRSKMYCELAKLEEDHKKAELVPESEETEGRCEITKDEYHQSLKAKWNRLSQKIIVHLGAKEMAALCQELEVVGSSEELSSVMHSGGANTIVTPAADNLSLQAQIKELRTRNEEIMENAYIDAQTAKATELELESALQKSIALEKEIDKFKNENELHSVMDKQSTLIDYYETTVGDMRTRIDELEDLLAATSSKALIVDSCGKPIPDESLLDELLVENRRLKSEVARVCCQLEVAGTQVDWEIEKKEAVLAELMVLQNQKAIYDATKAELVELRKMKQIFDADNAELVELRSLKRTLEAERDELAALRSQKKTFDVAENEFKEVYKRLPQQKTLLKAADEQLQETVRRQKETLQAAIEELSGLRDLKATCEAVTEEHITAMWKQKSSFETAATEELRKQKAFFGTVAKELEELRKQKEMSNAEREELESLRKEIATLRAADGESATFRSCENAANEQSLLAKVERLNQKQAKLVSNIKYLERKRIEDKQEHDRYCLQLEAEKMTVHLMCVDLKAAEQELLSVIKENENEKEVLHEAQIRVLNEKEVLHREKNCLSKEKQNLERTLSEANEEVTDLRLEIERMEKAKARVELESTALTRTLFLKEAKTESLKAKLRLQSEENMDQVRKLREELVAVTKQLNDAADGALCQICHENTRDTVLLPCAHMQSCVRCVKVLIQGEESCPSCNRAVSGFVFCNSDD